jgi:hypothetical protein
MARQIERVIGESSGQIPVCRNRKNILVEQGIFIGHCARSDGMLEPHSMVNTDAGRRTIEPLGVDGQQNLHPGRGPPCSAMPDQVRRCMWGI